MSNKRFTLLDAVSDFDLAHKETSANKDSNFELCFISQLASGEQLFCPATNSTHTDKSSGYLTIAQQLNKFEAIGELPRSISSRISDLMWKDLLERLLSNKAKFHKKCRNQFDKQHYDKASKKRKLSDDSASNMTSPLSTRARYTA